MHQQLNFCCSSVVLTSDGTVFMSGANSFGELMDDSFSLTFSQFTAMTLFGSLTNKTPAKVVNSITGVFIMATDGSLHAWGSNECTLLTQ